MVEVLLARMLLSEGFSLVTRKELIFLSRMSLKMTLLSRKSKSMPIALFRLVIGFQGMPPAPVAEIVSVFVASGRLRERISFSMANMRYSLGRLQVLELESSWPMAQAQVEVRVRPSGMAKQIWSQRLRPLAQTELGLGGWDFSLNSSRPLRSSDLICFIWVEKVDKV